jgi:hypothetical protein
MQFTISTTCCFESPLLFSVLLVLVFDSRPANVSPPTIPHGTFGIGILHSHASNKVAATDMPVSTVKTPASDPSCAAISTSTGTILQQPAFYPLFGRHVPRNFVLAIPASGCSSFQNIHWFSSHKATGLEADSIASLNSKRRGWALQTCHVTGTGASQLTRAIVLPLL